MILINTTEMRFNLTDIINYLTLNLFAVSVSDAVSAAIFAHEKFFFCHDITTFNIANSEMFWVNTLVNFLFSFIGEKINKRLRRFIRFPL